MTIPIYVEIFIRAPLDELWERTQDPTLHQRWDLRFTEIDYLPRGEGHSQRFLYGRRFAPGLTIRGVGETVGERHKNDGTSTSALKFWSDDHRSLIAEGSGYWRYIPTTGGIRFLTRYDYRPRWGALGRAVDRFMFRPLIGWATAWSFDRLRLWLERDIEPERALAHAAGRSFTRLVALTAICVGLRERSAMRSIVGVAALVAPWPLPVPSASRCLRQPLR